MPVEMPTLTLQPMNYMYCTYTCPSQNTTNGTIRPPALHYLHVLHCTLSQHTDQGPMASAPSLQADSIIGIINASELNGPTLQVRLAPAVLGLSAKEPPAAKHPRVIGAPRIIMLVETHNSGIGIGNPHNIRGTMNWSPPLSMEPLALT